MTKKSDRIVIRLDEADNEWIAEQAEQIGIGKAGLVRMLIRRARSIPMQHPIPDGAIIEPAPNHIAYSEVEEGFEEFPAEESEAGSDADIQAIVAARLKDAPQMPAPVQASNGHEVQMAAVRPLLGVRKPTGRDWMQR